jgi:hypothetical protein
VAFVGSNRKIIKRIFIIIIELYCFFFRYLVDDVCENILFNVMKFEIESKGADARERKK